MPHIVSLAVGYMDILEKFSKCHSSVCSAIPPAEDGNYTGYKDDHTVDDDDNALMAG